MSDLFSNLKPAHMWAHFAELLKIPRCSGNEQAVGDYVISVTEKLNLEYKRDGVGNVVVQKPAISGYEQSPVVILQGHMDMVCEKNSDVDHDFNVDPIQAELDGDWLTAKGTTLGADNGIGVAAALAVMEDDSLVHGPLEMLFTVDEERGLTGASQIQPGFLDGRILINLDSEEEGAFFIGCAGGGDSVITVPIKTKAVPKGTALNIRLTGLRGGHSGIDIDQGRGNAIKLLAIMLWQVGRDHSFHLAHFEGGSKRNAIAREAEAHVVVSDKTIEDFQKALQSRFEDINAEFKAVETEMVLNIENREDGVSGVCNAASQETFLNLIFGLPHGVLAMSQEIPDLVETSNNVATVEWGADVAKIGLSSRSSIGSALETTRNMLKAIADMAGAEIEQPEGYPSWAPNLESQILKVMKKIYKDLFKKEAEIKAIHAGLECGLIGEKFPGMDMISFGPDLEHPHSPDERVRVESVQNFWRLLETVLQQLAIS